MTDPHDGVVTVASVAEALSHLATQRGRARIVAGLAGLGTRLALPQDAYLVDVSEVAALRRVESSEAEMSLGSALPLATLAQHAAVLELAPVLSAAAVHLVDAGLGAETLGARIVSARGGDPLNVALVASSALVEITNLTGSQWLPVASLYVREGVSRVDSSSEIVTRVRVPVLQGVQGAGLGIVRDDSSGDDFALAMALTLGDGGERFKDVQIAHGGSWMVPAALEQAAKMLIGVNLGDEPSLRGFVSHVIDLEVAALGDAPEREMEASAFRSACHRALKDAARMARRRLSAGASDESRDL